MTNQVTARVIARDGAIADALATALTVVGPAGAQGVLDRFPEVVISLSVAPVQARDGSVHLGRGTNDFSGDSRGSDRVVLELVAGANLRPQRFILVGLGVPAWPRK